jgi:hypothetical protein
MTFGKKKTEAKQETVAQAYESATSPQERAAWAQAIEWKGANALADFAVRETVANVARKIAA